MLSYDQNIVIVASSKLMREMLSDFLENKVEYNVICTEIDKDAFIVLQSENIYAIIYEMDPTFANFKVLSQLIVNYPAFPVLCLANKANILQIKRLLYLGCRGVVCFSQGFNELSVALTEIGRGKTYLSSNFHQLLQASRSVDVLELSESERAMVEMIYVGKSNREISEKMFLSVRTIENKRYNLMQKLGLTNVNAVIRAVIHQGLLNPFV
jgi:two-component system response regulator NreC